MRAAIDFPQRVLGLVEIAASPRFVRSADWPHAVAETIFREFASALGAAFRPTIERFLALESVGDAIVIDQWGCPAFRLGDATGAPGEYEGEK